MKKAVSVLLLLCLTCLPLTVMAEPEVIVPEAYTQNGTMPIYRATARDFGDGLQPELFNQSGIASRDEYNITFEDEAILSWAPEALFYNENSGTFDANAKEGGEASYTPLGAMSDAIAGLASWASAGWPDTNTVYQIDKTALTNITLEEAKQTLEALLAKLNVTGYVCGYALDMSLERIVTLGDDMNAMIAAGEFFTNVPSYDFHAATEEDEGYYLSYHKPLDGGDYGSSNLFSVYAYVTTSGVVYLFLRDMYIQGEVYSTPEKLVEPQIVLDSLPKEIAASQFPSEVASIARVRLTYAPMRAPKKSDGMVLSPIWLVIYQDEEAKQGGYNCWAEFDAITGKLISAIFAG